MARELDIRGLKYLEVLISSLISSTFPFSHSSTNPIDTRTNELRIAPNVRNCVTWIWANRFSSPLINLIDTQSLSRCLSKRIKRVQHAKRNIKKKKFNNNKNSSQHKIWGRWVVAEVICSRRCELKHFSCGPAKSWESSHTAECEGAWQPENTLRQSIEAEKY